MVLSVEVVLGVVDVSVISLVGYLAGNFVGTEMVSQGLYNDCVIVSAVVSPGLLGLVVVGLEVYLGIYFGVYLEVYVGM